MTPEIKALMIAMICIFAMSVMVMADNLLDKRQIAFSIFVLLFSVASIVFLGRILIFGSL
ncbi:MAG: hypothetical protein GY853_14385 [PVC group bacterium]|nr:hypothetical protein [PVC group bacterium]